ncbi:MAG: carbohydrate-binding family 9-like protein, partial [Gemmatimonadota bacterium]
PGRSKTRLSPALAPEEAAALAAAMLAERCAQVARLEHVEPAIPFAPRTYVAYRAEELIRVDGRLDEAAWQGAAWTDDFVDIEGPSKPAPRFRTRARMLWDSANLYIGAELADPDVWGTVTQRDAVIFRDNDFEVFIDPDGDTHQYYELEVNALGTAWDLFLVMPYRDGGPAINGWDIHGLQVGVRVDGTLNRPGDTDRGWSVELALPWAALREAAHRSAPPAPGDQWRINLSRVEWRTRVEGGRTVKLTDSTTGRPLPEDNWVWSPQGVVNMHYPETWGVVQFSAHAAGQGADTAAVRDEDVVKWLLRIVYYREQAFHARQGYYTDDLTHLGLERPPLPGWPWPPVISVTPNGYEASLPVPGGRRLVINPDGAVR